ncbi:MAG TPA: DUF2934 domain-containing protein [Candidatus Acidoferrum sp.]|nr:DUF2934 domain-containing protein [Candidatus Acidoferrum sp.]
MSRTDKKTATQKEIELRAYEIYLQRCGEDGNQLSDWLTAEKELNDSLQMDTAEPTVPDVMPLRKRAAVS